MADPWILATNHSKVQSLKFVQVLDKKPVRFQKFDNAVIRNL